MSPEEIVSGREDLLYERVGRVATVTINRPHRRNALAGGLTEQIYNLIAALAQDSSLGVLVVRGAGNDFCAGFDMHPDDKDVSDKDRKRDPFARDTRRYSVSLLLHNMPAVTIAAIRGACAGAGLGWACGCDFRVSDTTARFNTAFLDVGVAGDMGGPWSLSRIVGGAKARDLYLFPRRFDAQEAFDMGLTQRLFAPEEFDGKVQEMVQRLANAAPLALAGIKANFLEAEKVDFASYTATETLRHLLLFNTADRSEAMRAFVEKRPPNFTGG